MKQHRRGQSTLPISDTAKLVILSLLIACAPEAIAQTTQNPSYWQAQYTPIYVNNIAPSLAPGLQLQNGAAVVTDPALVISGQAASIHLTNYGTISTDPAVVQLSGNTTYIVEFQYRILSPGSVPQTLRLGLQPVGATDPALMVDLAPLLKNATVSGTFSSGALVAGSSSYVLFIASSADSDVIVGNITIYKQSVKLSSTPPPAWNNLLTLPYPRLGSCMQGDSLGQAASGGLAEGPPFRVSVDQVENVLAFADVLAESPFLIQTQSPDFVRRIRMLNPNAVLLPYRVSEEQQQNIPKPAGSDQDPDYKFLQGLADGWYLRDSKGNYVYESDFPQIRLMNISPAAPVVNSQTYFSYLQSWLNTDIFPTGLWDGIFFDNLFGRINPHIPNSANPALLNVNYNLNAARETPAAVSDLTRSAALGFLHQLKSASGPQPLIMGNAGPLPELSLAPYVNGYLLEGVNWNWNAPYLAYLTKPSMAGWRRAFDAYRAIQTTALPPRINLLTGSGLVAMGYSVPTADDIQEERFTMGTTLLGDGFYQYNLHGCLSAPVWFDEYSVDSSGTAVEDRTKKGYLGQPLSDAAELTGPGSRVFQESFENGVVPASFVPNPPAGVSVSQTPGNVISGTGSLVISNSDHTSQGYVSANTNPALVLLSPSTTYLLTFDWRILQTLDFEFQVDVINSDLADSNSSKPLDVYPVSGVVAGDSGTVSFPFTIPTAGSWTIRFAIVLGGGSVAIDNVRLSSSAAGAWRRDFENGFVLVNPLSQPHTFAAADLAGALSRTGIHRIKGTQAPDINNGQPVTSNLTLAPFDAIILLADPIHLHTAAITGVSNAAGGQPVVASGSFVSIYGSNFTPLAYDDWSKSITNGRLPTELDGISVSIAGKPAYIYVITPGQINVQAPDVGNGSAVKVIVTTAAGASVPFYVNTQLYSPAFFPWPGNQPVATHADYSWAAKNGTFPGTNTVPAKPGEVIVLWGTGFGPTTPPVPAGYEPTVQAPPTEAPVSVTLGGNPVQVLAAVLSSYVAEYQIAIQIPASMAEGNYAVVASVNGAHSPPNTFLTVQH